jgi:heterodisulfide reductase subunit B
VLGIYDLRRCIRLIYAYYPGCSLTGSARKLDKGVRKLFKKLGHTLKDIPDWNCCGAFEYGDRKELVKLSGENLQKAKGVAPEVLAPCPACSRNLKEANEDGSLRVYNPLDLFDKEFLSGLTMKRDLKGQVFTPYYGCVLMRPKETAIPNSNVMEDFVTSLGGDVAGEKIKDRCCGGNQFFINKWATEKLSRMILEKSKGTILVFCPLCQMALKTFSTNEKIIYFTDLILYASGEENKL